MHIYNDFTMHTLFHKYDTSSSSFTNQAVLYDKPFEHKLLQSEENQQNCGIWLDYGQKGQGDRTGWKVMAT